MASLLHTSRREFVAFAAFASLASAAHRRGHIPVGLELYSVRDQLKTDPAGTIRAVAQMGYQGVEFFSPYYNQTVAEAKETRKLLDDLKIRCFSTHNSSGYFDPEKIGHAIEINQALGSKFMVMASSPKVENLDGWKAIADKLTKASANLAPHGLRAGYHNHQTEFTPLDGRKPIELLAAGTPASVMLQLDVGTCLEAGADPVAWIQQNPGRINSLHCKDWSSESGKGYRVLFGEGVAPWKKIFEAAEKSGGVEYYLIEQEGSDHPALETAKLCLDAFRQVKAS